MWVLESEGDALEGRRIWLRPGKKFLFGRTSMTPEPGKVNLNDKTISRRHLTVELSAVGPADCPNARTRSKITLEDLETKIGTMVNGEQIRGKQVVLEKDQNSVTLGRYKYLFTFTWIPVTFTFSFTAKEQKADPYTALYKLLGPLDIKVLNDYERGYTTHVVARKRNTAKGLQALIDGKYIVHNDSFVKALVAATTTPETGEDGEAGSPLEVNWSENFPDPLGYLPPRGDEPTQDRDSSAYTPNPNRRKVFEGYKFIFYDHRQYENLLAPITDGSGKALFREVISNETEVADFVGYVKGVSGEKGPGEFEDGSKGRGVVIVRFNPAKGADSEWYSNFNRQVSLHLGYRLIEQNEFLDAILGNDISVLRKPLEVDPSGVIAPPPTANTMATSQTLRNSQPNPTPTPAQVDPSGPVSQLGRRGRSRRIVTTRFRGFDSDDEAPMSTNHVSQPVTVTYTPNTVESQSQSLFITQDPEMEVDPAPSQPPETQTRFSRKRNSPPMNYDLEDEEDIMEQMAPTATALKKRRLADDAARRRQGESTPPPPPPPPEPKKEPIPAVRTAKKPKKEIDVVEAARLQREKGEEQAKAQREPLQEDLGDKEIEALRDLVIIEAMDVTRREPAPRVSRADESDRWDDTWNGRKNFKKFRRRGEEGAGGRRVLPRIIVPLEEAKKKDYGIGDDYWQEGYSHPKKRKGKGKGRDTQDLSQLESQLSRQKNRASTRATEILAKGVEAEIVEDELLEDMPVDSDFEFDELPVAPPPKPVPTSRSQKFQKLADKTNATKNMSPKKKRVAETTLTKPAPVKKARVASVEVHDSDDSDDEFKFKFRRRA